MKQIFFGESFLKNKLSKKLFFLINKLIHSWVKARSQYGRITEKKAFKLKAMLDISKKCTDSVSWHWMEQQAESSDLVLIMCWLFVKVAHIQENTAPMASSWLGVSAGFVQV